MLGLAGHSVLQHHLGDRFVVHAGIEAFLVDAGELVQTKEWLARCGIPSSNYWTRQGIETLMFFRDPTGNVIELFCPEGYDGAADLPTGPARGHGAAIDIDELAYSEWRLP